MITNDAVVLGLLLAILALIFTTAESKHPFFQKFYKYIPSLLLCYFIPSLLGSFKIVDPENSKIYFVASRYLLPTSLILFTLSIDIPGLMRLGNKAIIMFLAGTVGIIIGGPIAILITYYVAPSILTEGYGQELWRGMATVAGSWIGGGANQTAMKEVFEVNDKLFSSMITVDVLVANVWMAFLLYGAANYQKIDDKMQADNSAIEELKEKIIAYEKANARIPSLADLMLVLGVGFTLTGIAHLGADTLAPFFQENYPGMAKFSFTSSFFWLVVIATTGGLALSFTKARELESAGASRLGSVFLYILVASIGMKMDIFAIFHNPGLFFIGFIWISIHIIILLTVAKIIKAPFFFVAVGSQANIGGAASAPIVASAFHPALATAGVLMAVLGYALGTYGAWLCAMLMQSISGSLLGG